MEFSSTLALSLILLLTLHILLSLWRQKRRYRSLPPGPAPLPLLGTPKYMNMGAATTIFPKLSQKYGSVFTIWKLTEPVVVLCGYETVKDALINHAEQFSARPSTASLDAFNKGYGLAGPRWRSLRRFIIASLRTFGMGKKVMEMRILEEGKCLIQAVSETEGKPFNPSKLMYRAIGSIISSVLFGEHLDYQDKKLQELLTDISKHTSSFYSPLHMLCNVFPVLLKFPVIKQKVIKEGSYLKSFVMKYIEEHKQTLHPESPRDFIDNFLLKIKEVEEEVDPDFCEISLLVMVVVLLTAGTETTTLTLNFCLIIIANYPDVQVKVQQEIDEVTRSLRPPEIMDKPEMPYTNAVIHEAQRVLDLAPIAFFHAVSEDIQFRGYTIPKGTTVIPFLTSVLFDPSQWETPEEFNPGHFLDEEGKFQPRAAFMPFSAGKRSCAGESLARMELFLLFSALLQKFTFKLVPGTERQDSKFLSLNKMDIFKSSPLCAEPRALPSM